MRLYLGGNFDLLHPGHIRLFKRCKELGTVIVALNTDDFAARYKRRPIMSLHERLEMVRSCRYVDEVVVNWTDENSRPTIVATRATHLVHGDDWTGDSYLQQLGLTEDWLAKRQIQVLYLPYTSGVSSSEIERRIASRIDEKTLERRAGVLAKLKEAAHV